MAPFERISVDSAVMGGKPCVKGTRVTVGVLLGLMADGMTTPQIIDEYPFLTESDLQGVLAFAAWRAQESDAPLHAAAS